MYTKFTAEQFLSHNFHIGHTKQQRDKKYNLYLVLTRVNIDVINITRNTTQLRRLVHMMLDLSYRRKKVLFVSENASLLNYFVSKINPGTTLDHPFVSIHWCPGMLSNFEQTRKAVKRIKNGLWGPRPHASNYMRVKKVINYYSGLLNMRRLPDLAFFCTAHSNITAILEAKTFMIPTIGVVDSNGSPYSVSYPIFGNDDSYYAQVHLLEMIFRAMELGIGRRMLYFVQRTLAMISKYYRSTLFLKKFDYLSRQALQVFTWPDRLYRRKLSRTRNYKVARNARARAKSMIRAINTFTMYRKLGRLFDIFRTYFPRKMSLRGLIRVLRYMVRSQQARTLLVNYLVTKSFVSNQDLFVFLYFILFKIDCRTRNSLALLRKCIK